MALTDGTLGNLVGGINQIAGPGSSTIVSANTQYNRSSDSWSTKTSLTEPRFDTGAFSLGGTGYIVAGAKVTGGSLVRNRDFLSYGFASDSWTVIGLTSPFDYPITNETMGCASDPFVNTGRTIGGLTSSSPITTHVEFTPTFWTYATPLPSQPRNRNTGGTC
jgi:hypothetical protein